MAEKATTYHYHRHGSIDLMKEYTICESLADTTRPSMIALERPLGYGALVGEFLENKGLLRRGALIVEVGGGYGSLMAGLLTAYADSIRGVIMIDISKKLLLRQRERLSPWAGKVRYLHADIHSMISSIRGVDLIILNEVIGDLDVMTHLRASDLPEDISALIRHYHLDIPDHTPFHLNVGAIALVDAICKQQIPAFISEHASDPLVPENVSYLESGLEVDSYPREIHLSGHNEYTIRFSHLIRVASVLGRTTSTGALLDLVSIRKTPEMRFIFTAKACSTPRQEIILEFLDHIREYRWLVIG